MGASSETGLGTTGYDPTNPNEYDPTRYGWVARLSRNAAAEWGTTTEDAVANIEATQPDLVIIGRSMANEYVSNVDPAVAEANLRQVVTNIRDARPGVDIILITHPNINWPDASRPWSTYTAINHRVATDMGLGLMDMQQYIDSPSTNGAEGVWADDNAHLADAGQAAQSAAVWSLLWMQLAAC